MAAESQVRNVVTMCERFIAEKQYRLALQHLEQFDCALSNWAKAKAYMKLIEEMADSFMFVNYRSEDLLQQYRKLVAVGLEVAQRVVIQLRFSSPEVVSYVQGTIWHYLAHFEFENRRYTPPPPLTVDELYDPTFDLEPEELHQANVDSIINYLDFWHLKSDDI